MPKFYFRFSGNPGVIDIAKTRRHLGSMSEDDELLRCTLESARFCLKKRKLMLQGTFSSCPFHCFQTPVLSPPAFSQGGPDASLNSHG